jgi:hypothetical protein
MVSIYGDGTGATVLSECSSYPGRRWFKRRVAKTCHLSTVPVHDGPGCFPDASSDPLPLCASALFRHAVAQTHQRTTAGSANVLVLKPLPNGLRYGLYRECHSAAYRFQLLSCNRLSFNSDSGCCTDLKLKEPFVND